MLEGGHNAHLLTVTQGQLIRRNPQVQLQPVAEAATFGLAVQASQISR